MTAEAIRAPEATSPAASERASLGPQVLALALAVALGYANSLCVPFLLDDPRPADRLAYASRPLVWGSFALNRALGAEALWNYHAFNALVHLACGLALYGVLRRGCALAAPALAGRARDAFAFVTSLLWLCHPLQTASITYLSQRAEALAALFYLLLVYAFLRALTAARPRPWQLLALASLACGFATKEIIATAPALVFLFDAMFVAGGPVRALRARRGFYAALALAALACGLLWTAPELLRSSGTAGLKLEEFGPLEYARTQPGVLLHYLRLAVWPHPLCFDYGWPIARTLGAWLPQTLVVAALLGATACLCLRRSWIGFLGASFFLVLLPTSSFVPIRDPAFEHRMYLPLAAVLALAVAGARGLVLRLAGDRARAAPPVLAACAALALLGLTVLRNRDYGTEVGLWQLTVAEAPKHARAHANLGAALLDAGRTEEAIRELFEALALDTQAGYVSMAVSPVAYLKLGHAYDALGEAERALPFYRRAVELCEWPDSLAALGEALLAQGDDAGAAEQFGKLLALAPLDASAHVRLGEVLARNGRAAEAEPHFEAAVRLAPEREDGHLGLANLLAAQGRTEEALAEVKLALALPPDSAGEHFSAGQWLATLGRFDEALAAFRDAMRLAPELPAPCAGFARCVSLKPGATPAERQEALQLATRAIEMTGSSHAGFLEVGARASAALGDFARAMSWIEQALKTPDAGADPAVSARLQALRAEYLGRAGR